MNGMSRWLELKKIRVIVTGSNEEFHLVIHMLYQFYKIPKFYRFTCTLLDSGMTIRIMVCLKRLHRISWQDWPTFWQDQQKVCQIPRSFYQRVLEDSLVLPEGFPNFGMSGEILPPLVRILFVGVTMSCSWAQHWLKVTESILGSSYILVSWLRAILWAYVYVKGM